ncbi:hypothetical protein [Mesobacillus harenae]|uniref:hypothetical protein n=1 Tax=Mesobacillus harenae TaxID=2213203 RepID=UPI0015804259|nr:hypothetical protein [Mesobacillus harenae]
MKIIRSNGYELEKEKSNTSEDFFNRSEVTFAENGQEKTLHVLYVRFFEEQMQNFTPYEQDPIFKANSREVFFRDIVALVCLLKNPGFRHRKRVYINSQQDFAEVFSGINYEKVTEVLMSIESGQPYELQSALEFIIQPT